MSNPHSEIADVNPQFFSAPEQAAFHLTQATLALAYEQRTANLIGIHAALRERRDNRQAMDLLTEIKERLGLK